MRRDRVLAYMVLLDSLNLLRNSANINSAGWPGVEEVGATRAARARVVVVDGEEMVEFRSRVPS